MTTTPDPETACLDLGAAIDHFGITLDHRHVMCFGPRPLAEMLFRRGARAVAHVALRWGDLSQPVAAPPVLLRPGVDPDAVMASLCGDLLVVDSGLDAYFRSFMDLFWRGVVRPEAEVLARVQLPDNPSASRRLTPERALVAAETLLVHLQHRHEFHAGGLYLRPAPQASGVLHFATARGLPRPLGEASVELIPDPSAPEQRC